MTQLPKNIRICVMSKKLIASTLFFVISIILAVLVIVLDRIDQAKVGGGYINGSQIDTVIKK